MPYNPLINHARFYCILIDDIYILFSAFETRKMPRRCLVESCPFGNSGDDGIARSFFRIPTIWNSNELRERKRKEREGKGKVKIDRLKEGFSHGSVHFVYDQPGLVTQFYAYCCLFTHVITYQGKRRVHTFYANTQSRFGSFFIDSVLGPPRLADTPDGVLVTLKFDKPRTRRD